jgi:hypothetical protein
MVIRKSSEFVPRRIVYFCIREQAGPSGIRGGSEGLQYAIWPASFARRVIRSLPPDLPHYWFSDC